MSSKIKEIEQRLEQNENYILMIVGALFVFNYINPLVSFVVGAFLVVFNAIHIFDLK